MVGLMLGQRRRFWANVQTALGERLVLTWMWTCHVSCLHPGFTNPLGVEDSFVSDSTLVADITIISLSSRLCTYSAPNCSKTWSMQ